MHTHILRSTLLAAVATLLLTACSDDPGVDNYYTASAEYAIDYLQNRPQFSMFNEIVSRATGEKGSLRLPQLLGTYGTYTVFAPTNEAVTAYLAQRGLNQVDQLSKEDCDTIALNAIIEQTYYTTDYSDATLPTTNMLSRYMTITCDSDQVGDQVELKLYINHSALITHADDSVKNGVVHTVGTVVSTTNDFLPSVLERDSTVSIYYEALCATHMKDSLMRYIDDTYTIGSDSVDWSNDALCVHTGNEYDNVAYMTKRFIKFTAFMVQDDVLATKYGIHTLDDLRQKARELYDPMYPDDTDVTDETDRRNSLNRFISYHLLPFSATYYQLTCVDGEKSTLAMNWNRRKVDIADWYETMMPYSLLKCSFPSGTATGLYLNRRGIQSRADERGIFVRGSRVASPSQVSIDQTALNGNYMYIDDIIAYDENTQHVVLNERLRMDVSSLSPDFMTSGARGHYTLSNIENGKYGNAGQGAIASQNVNHCLGFKPGSARNFSYTKSTHLHVRNRILYFDCYQGDEVIIKGNFDFTVKLPPVPAGTYELRVLTCVGFSSRGIVQSYIDGAAAGIPYDMRKNGVEQCGWQDDSSLGDEDAIASFDKALHNLGWMKGPKSYYKSTTVSGGTWWLCFRDNQNVIRRIIGTFVSDGKTDHYLRMQQKLESANNELSFDFIELVPSSVYNNEYFPEDRW
jgi:uncharacterized surface protein with fasciclin (FAS1) repeats